MSIRKGDLYELIELVSERNTKLVYDLLKTIIENDNDNEKELIIEADNSPLTEEEKEILKQAETEIKNGDLIDWEEINE